MTMMPPSAARQPIRTMLAMLSADAEPASAKVVAVCGDDSSWVTTALAVVVVVALVVLVLTGAAAAVAVVSSRVLTGMWKLRGRAAAADAATAATAV